MGRSSTGFDANPIRVLYREVLNEQASWTDALFWYGLGFLTMWLVYVTVLS